MHVTSGFTLLLLCLPHMTDRALGLSRKGPSSSHFVPYFVTMVKQVTDTGLWPVASLLPVGGVCLCLSQIRVDNFLLTGRVWYWFTQMVLSRMGCLSLCDISILQSTIFWPTHAPLHLTPRLHYLSCIRSYALPVSSVAICSFCRQSSWTAIFQVSQAWFTFGFAVFQPEHLIFYSKRLLKCKLQPSGVLLKLLSLGREVNNIYFLLWSQQ